MVRGRRIRGMMRGYAAIALDNVKDKNNVGSALRACDVYGAAMLVTSGRRYRGGSMTDTLKSYQHLPLVEVEVVFDSIPYDCIPVAVDLVPDAESLVNFKHPERAFYIFGAEDNTLGKRITDRCKY